MTETETSHELPLQLLKVEATPTKETEQVNLLPSVGNGDQIASNALTQFKLE